jgi:hypothetical protein
MGVGVAVGFGVVFGVAYLVERITILRSKNCVVSAQFFKLRKKQKTKPNTNKNQHLLVFCQKIC